MTGKGKKVFVGMSGGVDSSVSAALLKKQGYDVTGVFMNVWQPDFINCSRSDDRHDAMRVAAHLNIPFLTFDFEEEYKKEVVDYMVAGYRAGRTPNPDVMCNKYVKFGAFLKKARRMGADYIATGHYAQTNENYELLKGVYIPKDQTYFLWTIKKEHLKHTIFPIGDLTKPEVRALAEEFGLPNAKKRESQGVCFLGEFDMRDFLTHFIPKKKGDVVGENGEVLGFHDGAFLYTLGQRHGFTITKKTPTDTPYYIIEKSVTKNTLTVSHDKEAGKHTLSEVVIGEVNFTAGVTPKEGVPLEARIRYRQPLEKCRIVIGEGGSVKVIFERPQLAVASGQSLVLYDREVCLGGGIIV